MQASRILYTENNVPRCGSEIRYFAYGRIMYMIRDCKGKKRIAARKKGLVVAAVTCALLMTACATVDEGADNIVLIEKEAESIAYEMAVVSVADVVKTEKVRCIYQQVNDEQVSFSVGGKRIDKVYVQKGDSVKKGQLLATLDTGNAADTIETLEYRITRNKMTLEYSQLNEDYEISTLWLRYLYQSGQSEAEKKALEENVASIQQRYRYSREDCEDAIALDEKELSLLKQELKDANLCAGMDGTISFVKSNLEGSASIEGEEIMRIIDSSECLFAVENVDYAPYFKEGVATAMNISSGTGAGDYELIPYDMENWGEKLLFTIANDDGSTTIDVGTMGIMKVVLGEKKQVLSVPVGAVHIADGKSYVYVLGEDNMREVKWIETGLLGDAYAEVISGLEEGEKVILQ